MATEWFVQIAKVRYVDHEVFEHPQWNNTYLPYFLKRREYESEAEVRAMVQYLTLENHPKGLDEEVLEHGANIEVDLSALIRRIVLAPKVDGLTKTRVAQLVAEAGLNVPVERSRLEIPPRK